MLGEQSFAAQPLDVVGWGLVVSEVTPYRKLIVDERSGEAEEQNQSSSAQAVE